MAAKNSRQLDLHSLKVYSMYNFMAGAMRDIKSGKIPEGSKIVCTLTGNGLKDPDTAIVQSTAPMTTVDATMDAVKNAIFGNMD